MTMTREKLDDILAGRRLVVSVSGGKDSTAVCLHLMELGYHPDEYDRIFMDTGWEHHKTLEYLRGALPAHVGPIEWLRAEVDLTPEQEAIALELEADLGQSPSAMVRWCVKKAIFPSRIMRWCTESLKIQPSVYWLAENTDSVFVVGIRAAESKARSILTEWDIYNAKAPGVKWRGDVWRPLLRWTYEDVIAIHQRARLAPNPLYLAKAERVGCWPCIFARKSEIRWMAEHDPGRIDFMERFEKKISELNAMRRESQDKGKNGDRGWFVNRSGRRDPKTGKIDGSPWPIRKVVEWSKTSRGGRQFELFTDLDGHQGCVRWGMCETAEEL